MTLTKITLKHTSTHTPYITHTKTQIDTQKNFLKVLFLATNLYSRFVNVHLNLLCFSQLMGLYILGQLYRNYSVDTKF